MQPAAADSAADDAATIEVFDLQLLLLPLALLLLLLLQLLLSLLMLLLTEDRGKRKMAAEWLEVGEAPDWWIGLRGTPVDAGLKKADERMGIQA